MGAVGKCKTVLPAVVTLLLVDWPKVGIIGVVAVPLVVVLLKKGLMCRSYTIKKESIKSVSRSSCCCGCENRELSRR